MDYALTVEMLVPAAKYSGSLTANTEAAYNAIRWEDNRPKPTLAELAAAQVEVQAKEAAKEAAEAAKITKRPKRSEINAVMAGIDGAETVGQLRIEVKKLASMMVNVLEIQSVPVVEDQL